MIKQFINEDYLDGYDIVIVGIGEIGAKVVENMHQPFQHIAHSLILFSEWADISSFSEEFKEYMDLCKQCNCVIAVVDCQDRKAVKRANKYAQMSKQRYFLDSGGANGNIGRPICRTICVTLSKYEPNKYEEFANDFDNIVFIDNINQLHLPLEMILVNPLKGIVGLDVCDVLSIFENGRKAHLVESKGNTIEKAIDLFTNEVRILIKENNINKIDILFEFSVSADANFLHIDDIAGRIANIIDTFDMSAKICWTANLDEALKDKLWISAIIAERLC